MLLQKMDEKQGLEKTILATQNMVYAIIYGYVENHSQTEDLCQETYLKAFSNQNNLKDESKTKSWLCTIARNTAIDWLRKRKEKVNLEMNSMSVEKKTPETNVEKEERIAFVNRILGELKPADREIIIMRYLGDMSYKEIASALKMSVSAVGEKLSRLLSNLEEKFKPLLGDLL